MDTTLDVVSLKIDDRSAEAAVAAELVRMAKKEGLSLTGPGRLLKLFTKNVLETRLNDELTEYDLLGVPPGQVEAFRERVAFAGRWIDAAGQA